MSHTMDTDLFLNAFYRMVSRRDFPQKVLFGNSNNTVGANNELQNVFGS